MKIRTYAALPCAIFLTLLTTAADGEGGCKQAATDASSEASLESATLKVAPTSRADLSASQKLSVTLDSLVASKALASADGVSIESYQILNSSKKEVDIDVKELRNANRDIIGVKNLIFANVGIYTLRLNLVNKYGVSAIHDMTIFQNEATKVVAGGGSKKWTMDINGLSEFKIYTADLIAAGLVKKADLTGKERFSSFEADVDLYYEANMDKVEGSYLFVQIKDSTPTKAKVYFGQKGSEKSYEVLFSAKGKGGGSEKSLSVALDGSGEVKIYLSDIVSEGLVGKLGDSDKVFGFVADDGDMECWDEFDKDAGSYLYCEYKDGSSGGTVSVGTKEKSQTVKVTFASKTLKGKEEEKPSGEDAKRK